MKEFSDIYQSSVQKVYRFLLGLTRDAVLAEELTQETFYQAYLHIGQFEGRCEIDTWLCQIAKNAYYREAKRLGRLAPQEMAENPCGADDLKKLETREQAMILHRLLHTMKEPYKEVFSLRVFGELTFKEIADVFGKSESWAKMTFYRAKARLVQQMEVQNGKDE